MEDDARTPSWRLRGPGTELTIRPRLGTKLDRLAGGMPPSSAAGEVARWFDDPIGRRELIEIWEYLCGHGAAGHALPPEELRQALVPAVEEALRDGRLVALRRREVAHGGSAEPPPAAAEAIAPQPARREATPWIEIELVDEDGEAVPNERYRITTSDGAVHEGTLDDRGFAALRGIVPGQCVVVFPDLEPARASGGTP